MSKTTCHISSKFRSISISSLVMVLITNLHGQIMIRNNYGSTTVVSLSEVLNFSVENTIPSSINVQLILSIEKLKTGQLALATSNTIALNPGPTIFSNELFNILRFSYSGSSEAKNLASTQVFEPGEYKICYKFINSNDNTVLGDYCTGFSIREKRINPTSSDTSKKKKFISMHGTSEVLFNYSTSQTNFTNLPPTYL